MSQADWELLDRQALGVVRLSLAKNVAYNIVNEKTTFGLIKALSNMYEKPSAANKVFLIRQLVNLKMKEGGSVTDHVNEFNSIISRVISVDIKFEDEVQALLLLSSLPDSWSFKLLPLSSVFRRLLEDSPALRLRISSPRIKSRIPSNDSLALPVELLTTVTVPDQLSGKDDNSSNAWTSTSNLISKDINREIIELNSLT
nr:retrovirus-related Pol polyprotein from transposon TNT 1-94 [Tanacetum cinerariifolium]